MSISENELNKEMIKRARDILLSMITNKQSGTSGLNLIDLAEHICKLHKSLAAAYSNANQEREELKALLRRYL